MALYDQFANEADLSRRFVRPLLNRMGFFLVTEYHGRREFGKDFVFSELHRFGGVRHYAAQVKHEKTIRLGSAIDDLCAQINQAFTNPFTLPDSQREAYVSAVYVFNSGDITDEAKDDLLCRLGKATYGDNVFFLDGERLESLNRWAGYQNDRYIRERLLGLRSQAGVNIGVWENTKVHFAAEDGPIEVKSCIMHGMDEYLSQPILPDLIDYGNVLQMRQWANAIENISVWMVRSAINTKALKKTNAQTVINTCEGAIECARRLIAEVDAALEYLRPL